MENSVKSFVKLKTKIGLLDREETSYHNRNHYVHPSRNVIRGKARLQAAVREMSPRSSPEKTERAAEIGSTYIRGPFLETVVVYEFKIGVLTVFQII